MITPILLHNYLLSDDEYNKLFDNKVKVESDWWEDKINNDALYPKDEDLEEMRKIAEDGQKNRKHLFEVDKYYRTLLHFGEAKDLAWAQTHKHICKEVDRILWERPLEITDEHIKDLHQRTLLGFSVIVSMSIKQYFESYRKNSIEKLKKEANAKNKKILDALPFDNIQCNNCNTVMQYQWSMLINDPNGDESVLFFYICPKQCGKQAIFEDGTPWISSKNENCAICQGNRSSTTTKDNEGNIYIIYECKKCGSRQVENIKRVNSS